MSRRDFEDDGRTIADMSGVVRPNLVAPRRSERPERRGPERRDDRPGESPFTPRERRIAAWAALKASLLIGMCYIVGLGAAILIMIWIWT